MANVNFKLDEYHVMWVTLKKTIVEMKTVKPEVVDEMELFESIMEAIEGVVNSQKSGE